MYSSLKTWKAIDWIGQLVIGVLPWVLAYGVKVIPALAFLQGQMKISLMGWQVVSFIVHLNVPGSEWKARGRRIYALLLGAMIFFGVVGFVTGLVFLWPLVIAFMIALQGLSILYLVVSYSEWRTVCVLERAEREGGSEEGKVLS